MGTVMLSSLAGDWHYAHINAIRGDGINPGLPWIAAPSGDLRPDR